MIRTFNSKNGRITSNHYNQGESEERNTTHLADKEIRKKAKQQNDIKMQNKRKGT